MAEAAQYPDAQPWYRAVYADQEPVGFVMISDGITVDNPDYLGPYYLWRSSWTSDFRAAATAGRPSTSSSRMSGPGPMPACSSPPTSSDPPRLAAST